MDDPKKFGAFVRLCMSQLSQYTESNRLILLTLATRSSPEVRRQYTDLARSVAHASRDYNSKVGQRCLDANTMWRSQSSLCHKATVFETLIL